MAKKIILSIIFLAAVGTVVFWYVENRESNDDGAEEVTLSVAVYNQSRNADAVTVDAHPNDVLVYTLTAHNSTDDVVSGFVIETNIADVSELASLIDAAGANYNAGTSSLMWTPLDIPAQNSITKQFSMRVKDPVPTGTDMVMSLSYSNEVMVNVTYPTVSGAATPTPTPTLVPNYEAPTTGPSLWFAAILGLVFTAGLFLYRTARRINA